MGYRTPDSPVPLGCVAGLIGIVALILALVLIVQAGYLLFDRLESQPETAKALADADPQSVGRLLFDSYLLPFELTSVLLLVAMIGAVVLTLERTERSE